MNDQNRLEVINFDVVSSNVSEKGENVVRAFRFLREQEFFKEIDKNEYIVWLDCGKHFRNQTVIGYLLIELAQIGIQGK